MMMPMISITRYATEDVAMRMPAMTPKSGSGPSITPVLRRMTDRRSKRAANP